MARSEIVLSPGLEAKVRREEERIGAGNVIERIVAPDAMKVAVHYRRMPTQYSYIVVKNDGSTGYDPIDPHVSAHDLTWALDSSRFVYVTQVGGRQIGSDVVLHEMPRKQSSAVAHFASGYAYSPSWSPKGDKLAILVADQSHI